ESWRQPGRERAHPAASAPRPLTPPSFIPTRSATRSMSVRCLTMMLIVGAQQEQSARPVDRFGDRGRLLEVELTDHVDDLDQPPGELLVDLRRVEAHDLHLAFDLRVVQPQVEAAALERLGELAGVV